MVSEHELASTLPGEESVHNIVIATMNFFTADLFSELLTCEEGFVREEQFMADMMSMTSELPTDLFDHLLQHLSVCGAERRNSRLKELRRYKNQLYQTYYMIRHSHVHV